MQVLRLECDFDIFKTAPLYYTLGPNYTTSDKFPGKLSIESKFKTTPFRLISFKNIVKAVFLNNNQKTSKRIRNNRR